VLAHPIKSLICSELAPAAATAVSAEYTSYTHGVSTAQL